MRKLIFILLIAFQIAAKGQEKLPVDFVGLWQDASEYESGWKNCYTFFPDSSFVFHFDIFDCYENCNTYYYKGKWKVVKDTLALSISQEKVIIDGKFLKTINDDVITIVHTGYDSIIKLDIPDVKKLKLKMVFTFDNSKESILIDEHKFWKIDNDPQKYNLE